jgi:flagellar basal-body rod modification protein FlgD
MLFPQLTHAPSDSTAIASPLPIASPIERSQLQRGHCLSVDRPGAHSTTAAASGAAASSTTPAPTSSSDTITSSDFLTLLVTELKNQDPTSNQDPNAYINQLVGVNSLQQLISINQELSPSTSPSAAPSVSSVYGKSADDPQVAPVTISQPGAIPYALVRNSEAASTPSRIGNMREP